MLTETLPKLANARCSKSATQCVEPSNTREESFDEIVGDELGVLFFY